VENPLTTWADGDGKLDRNDRCALDADACRILLFKGDLKLAEGRPPPFDHPLRRSDIHYDVRIDHFASRKRKRLRNHREPRLRRLDRNAQSSAPMTRRKTQRFIEKTTRNKCFRWQFYGHTVPREFV
jgi:hypothetical protein